MGEGENPLTPFLLRPYDRKKAVRAAGINALCYRTLFESLPLEHHVDPVHQYIAVLAMCRMARFLV